MRFELDWKRRILVRAVTKRATIALSYVAGGFIPLSPYILLSNAVARPVVGPLR